MIVFPHVTLILYLNVRMPRGGIHSLRTAHLLLLNSSEYRPKAGLFVMKITFTDFFINCSHLVELNPSS